jgi:hypothetical protein
MSRANQYELGFWRSAEATVRSKCAAINISLHYKPKVSTKKDRQTEGSEEDEHNAM